MSGLDDDQHKNNDGEWPYHVAFPAALWQGTGCLIIMDFCKRFKIRDVCYSVKHDGVDYIVYQFSDPREAARFCLRFNGRIIESKP
jgi:hypothetical protein